MDRPFNSPLTAHVALAPNIQLNLRGLTRSQRSEVNYSMKYGQSSGEAKRLRLGLPQNTTEQGGRERSERLIIRTHLITLIGTLTDILFVLFLWHVIDTTLQEMLGLLSEVVA